MAASIAFLNELVDRLMAAAKANRATPGRRGSMVHLNEAIADSVVVAGDLHGHRENFNKVVKAAKLDQHPRRHLVLQEVVHGGGAYPNGGCMSHMLLEEVAKLKLSYPDRFHFLLCNHELAEVLNQQLVKGGVSQNLLFATGLEYAYGPAARKIGECYNQFILSCPLAVRLSNGVFICHSLPDKVRLPTFDSGVFNREMTMDDLRAGGSANSLVWGRDYDADHVAKFLKIVDSTILLTGHEPTPSGFKQPNPHQIIFDCAGAECWACVAPVGRKFTAAELAGKLHRL